jgi:tetratricopeptide (TPR) repeat protein
MSNLAQLKQKARSFEQREQWQSALEVYEQITLQRSGADDHDPGLWNRIGDLHTRLGRSEEAISAYDHAVDAYAAAGLQNNAIALCNKILRVTSARPAVYLKLGLISASKGFLADARQHLGRFVSLMRDAERTDEALDRLREAIDAPAEDPAAVRRAVAEQLQACGHDEEAGALFRAAYRLLADGGRSAEAEQVRAHLDALGGDSLDPAAGSEDLGLMSPLPSGADAGNALTGLLLSDIAPLDGFESTAVEPLAADGFDRGAETAAGDTGAADAAASDDALPADELRLDLPLTWPGEETPPEEDTSDLPALTLILPEPEAVPRSDDETDTDFPSLALPADSLLPGLSLDAEEEAEDAAGLALVGLEIAAFPLTEVDRPEVDEPLPLVLLPAIGELDLTPGAVAAEPGIPGGDVGAGDPLAPLRAQVEADPSDRGAIERLVARLRGESADEESVRVLTSAIDALTERDEHAEALAALRLLIDVVPADAALLYQQVEIAFRTGETGAMVRAYLQLAARLEYEGGPDKARAVLERVLELDPDEPTARAALGFPESAPIPRPEDEYVDLAALIFEDEPEEETTRWTVEAEAPTGDEDHDFSEILARFREEVDRNIAPDDATSHYDLGVAFKEMGLYDEATTQFQKALHAGANPIATLEMLGECFVSQSQPAVGRRVLDRAVRLSNAADTELVGVLYWLGRCDEALGHHDLAAEYLERVLAVDFRFRDAESRLRAMQEVA